MAYWRVPIFSSHNCAQSSKKTFTYPKIRTNQILKYTKCHISTNLSNFLKLFLLYCQKLFALGPTNRRFVEKNRPSGNIVLMYIYIYIYMCFNCTVLSKFFSVSSTILYIELNFVPFWSSY